MKLFKFFGKLGAALLAIYGAFCLAVTYFDAISAFFARIFRCPDAPEKSDFAD